MFTGYTSRIFCNSRPPERAGALFLEHILYCTQITPKNAYTKKTHYNHYINTLMSRRKEAEVVHQEEEEQSHIILNFGGNAISRILNLWPRIKTTSYLLLATYHLVITTDPDVAETMLRCLLLMHLVTNAISFQATHPIASPTLLWKPLAVARPLIATQYLNKNEHLRFLRRSKAPTTRLHLSPSSCDSLVALSTILLSAAIGFTSDRMNFLGGNAGTIVTLTSAALLSNVGLFGLSVPISHPIYDICWTKFLPASLALVLLSSPKSSARNKRTNTVYETRQSSVINSEIVAAVAVPFWIGSLGSILGCIISAKFMVRCGQNGSSIIGMTPFEAAIAAGEISW